MTGEFYMRWRELHIHDAAREFCIDITTNEVGDREYTGRCLEKSGKPIAVAKAAPFPDEFERIDFRSLPEESMEQAGCFFLVNADETRIEKSVAAEEYPELLERLTDLMRREARYQKTLARQWNQPEYALFAAIRRGDFQKVRAMCEAEPGLVNAVAPKKPIDSTYFSPLQVALSAGWIRQVNWHTWVNWKKEIARYLLERGADVNYCPADTHGKVDDPVLHSAVINAAWNLPRTFLRRNLKNGVLLGSWNEIHTAEESDAAFAFLESMLERGADPNLCHRDGRNALFEAVGGCAFAYDNADVKTPELKAHIQRMIALLTDAGADKNNFSKISKKTIAQTYASASVWEHIGVFF